MTVKLKLKMQQQIIGVAGRKKRVATCQTPASFRGQPCGSTRFRFVREGDTFRLQCVECERYVEMRDAIEWLQGVK